jgi:hypothetical protein
MINLNHECACLNRETNSQTGSELFPENMILSLSVSFLHEGQPELNKILSLVDSVTEFKSGRKRSKHKQANFLRREVSRQLQTSDPQFPLLHFTLRGVGRVVQ